MARLGNGKTGMPYDGWDRQTRIIVVDPSLSVPSVVSRPIALVVKHAGLIPHVAKILRNPMGKPVRLVDPVGAPGIMRTIAVHDPIMLADRIDDNDRRTEDRIERHRAADGNINADPRRPKTNRRGRWRSKSWRRRRRETGSERRL